MTALSSDVTAALASLRTRWGEAAPRIGGAALGGSGTVVGALATVPLPEDPDQAPRRSPDDDRVIRTGFAALDAILGTGGIPRSAALAVRGAASSGKTTLALRLAAEAQAAGSIVAYLDLARSLDPVEAVARGVRLEWLVVLEPASLEEALAMAGALVAGRSVDLLIVDLPADRASPPGGRPRRGPDGRRLPSIADRLGRLAALARRADVLLVVLEPPGLPAPVSSAIAESAGLRLELARRSWIRLGRDVVGQWTEVVVARNRAGPPGRRADLRILYAEGGGRDACLLREPLLTDAPTTLQPRIDHRATPPSPLAAPSTPAQPSAGDGRPGLRLLPDRSARPRRATLDGRDRSSTPARRRTTLGVRRGMPLGSAHRLAPEATFLDPDVAADAAAVERALEALAAFSPGIAGATDPTDPAFGLLEVQVDGLDRLWGAEPVLVERIVAALRADPSRSTAGRHRRDPFRGDDRGRRGGAARSALDRRARWRGRPSSARCRPRCSPPIPTSGLGSPGSGCAGSRRSPSCRARRSSLGSAWRASGSTPARTAGDRRVPAPPCPRATRSWGSVSSRRSRISSRSGSSSIAWPAALADQLLARGAAAGRVELRLVLDLAFARRGTPRMLAIQQRFPEPTAEGEAIERLLLARLEREPPPAAVARLELELAEVTPAAGQQLALFVPQAARSARLSWQLARLALAFGEDRIGRVELVDPEAILPERRWRRLPIGSGSEAGFRPLVPGVVR